MLFYIKLAWRNMLRNKRRTLIAGFAIGTGLAALIFVDALMEGMYKNLIDSVTDTWMGDAQIHCAEYVDLQDPELTVKDAEKVTLALRRDTRVKVFARRTLNTGMLSSSVEAASVLVAGIDPEEEADISKIDNGIIEGEYLNEKNGNGLIIGSALADLLETGIGDRLVLTLTDESTGELSQELFRVTGIFYLNIEEMEKGMILIPIETAARMTGAGADFHEIAVVFNEQRLGMDEGADFYKQYSKGGNEAKSWSGLMPQMKMIMGMKKISMSVMGLIIFGIVIFGIMNTLFMSIYERMFEFGVMRAVGTSKGDIRLLIMLEALSLSVISVLIGIVMGMVITYIISKTGIDYSGIEFGGTTMTDLLYPILQVQQFIIYPLAVICSTLVVGIYPAVTASKMTIAGAIRKSL